MLEGDKVSIVFPKTSQILIFGIIRDPFKIIIWYAVGCQNISFERRILTDDKVLSVFLVSLSTIKVTKKSSRQTSYTGGHVQMFNNNISDRD